MTENKKALTVNTMLLTILDKSGKNVKVTNYIIDLCPISIEVQNNKFRIKIINEKLKIDFEKDNEVVLTITDDPYMLHAGDFSNLGCFRFRFYLKNVKKLRAKHLTFEGEEFNFNQINAERRFPDDKINTTALSLW